MNRALQIAHLGLLLAGAALCVCACLALASMDAAVEGASEATQQAVSGMQGVEQELTATLQAINRPCGAGKPCGTLADVAKTLNSARLTLGQVEIAANHEDSRIGVLDAQEAQIASDAHTLALKAGGTVDALTGAAKGLQPVEQSASGELDSLRSVTAHLDAMTPDLERTADELAATSANVTATSEHLNATTGDVEQAVHSYLHPTWPKRIWSAVTNGAVEVGKFFF